MFLARLDGLAVPDNTEMALLLERVSTTCRTVFQVTFNHEMLQGYGIIVIDSPGVGGATKGYSRADKLCYIGPISDMIAPKDYDENCGNCDNNNCVKRETDSKLLPSGYVM